MRIEYEILNQMCVCVWTVSTTMMSRRSAIARESVLEWVKSGWLEVLLLPGERWMLSLILDGVLLDIVIRSM